MQEDIITCHIRTIFCRKSLTLRCSQIFSISLARFAFWIRNYYRPIIVSIARQLFRIIFTHYMGWISPIVFAKFGHINCVHIFWEILPDYLDLLCMVTMKTNLIIKWLKTCNSANLVEMVLSEDNVSFDNWQIKSLQTMAALNIKRSYCVVVVIQILFNLFEIINAKVIFHLLFRIC